MHTLENPDIVNAQSPKPYHQQLELVRNNFERAGGGSASRTAATETGVPLPDLGELPLEEYPVGGEKGFHYGDGEFGSRGGKRDRKYLVSNADGNEASQIAISTKLSKSSTQQPTLYITRSQLGRFMNR